MARDRAASAQQASRSAARRRSPRAERHFLGAAIRRAIGSPCRAVWPAHYLLQPLRAVAEGGCMGSDDGRHHRRTPRRHPDDRQHFRSCPSTGCDGKKGGTDADHCLGRSRGGLTTKIHAVVDPQGLPIRLGLTTGQAHDGQIADTLLHQLGPHTIVLADKAYDADRIRQLIQDQGATPNIPPKSNRRWKPCFSRRLYRERNLIERFFSKLKHFRRVATRYDKLAANFLAMVQLASMRLWMRANEPTG